MSFYCEGGGQLNIKGNNIFTRNIIIEDTNTESIRKRFNNKDCYISAYKYDTQDLATANLFGSYYIDLDYELHNDNDLKVLQYDLLQITSFLKFQCDIPKEYIKVYFSGCKGFHIILDANIFGINTFKSNLNVQYKAFSKYIYENIISYKTIDLKIYDRARLFRMTNSINSKTNLYKVPIQLEFATKCKYNELIEYAIRPKLPLFNKNIKITPIKKAIEKFNNAFKKEGIQINNRSIINRNGKVFEVPACVRQMIQDGATQGNRNSTCVIIASTLLQSGKNEEEVQSLVQEWNNNTTPRLSDKEINAVIKSAIKEFNSGKGYGCSSIKELGYCIGAECRCYK